MRPWANNCLARHLQVVHQAENGIAVGISPAANGHHRALNCRPVFTHRAVLPVAVAQRVLHPQCREKRHVFKPMQPLVVPTVADQCRIGRATLVGQHNAAPPQVIVEQAAAFVVNVVVIAVVGGAHGDDGF